MAIQIQFRRDTAANWTSVNPTLALGELGFETDTLKFKIGTGVAAWTALSYVPTQGADGVDGIDGTNGTNGTDGADGVGITPQVTGFTLAGGTTSKTLTVTGDATISETPASANVATTFTAQQTFKETADTVYAITDGAAFEIDPANGNVQTITLGASRTPAATNFAAGQCVLLGVDDGTAYAITWTSVAVTWVKGGGTATAPTLATTGYTWILLWKVGSVIYGAEVGKP